MSLVQIKTPRKSGFLKEAELLRKKLDSYHDFFIKLPLRIQTRKDYEFGKLSVEESLNAFEKGDFMKANKKLNEGKSRISYADAEVNAHLKEYFGRFSKWQQWVQSTIVRLQPTPNLMLWSLIRLSTKVFFTTMENSTKSTMLRLAVTGLETNFIAGDIATPEGRYMISGKKKFR